MQSEIDLLASNLLFVGALDVPNDDGLYTAASGLTNGPLPAPAAANAQFYVIVIAPGSPPAGEIPPGTYGTGDWLVSTGTVWVHLPVGQADVTAPNVALTPTGRFTASNVSLSPRSPGGRTSSRRSPGSRMAICR